MDQPIYKNNSPPSSGSPPDSEKTRLNHWAEFLTARKITPTDIDYTVEKSIREGEKEDSAKNDELKRVRQALEDFQQTLPPEKLKELEVERDTEVQRGSPSVQLPSELNTIIYRKDFIPSPPKTTFPGYQFFSAIRTRFFGPTVGQGAKTAVQEVGQKGLQAVGKGLTKGTTALLTKAGLHTAAAAVSAGIGNVIIVVAPKILKAGSSLVNNTVKWVSSGFGFFTAFTEGLTGQRETPENKDLKFLIPVVGGLLALILFLGIFQIINTSSAFLSSPSATRYSGIFPPSTIPPNSADLMTIINEVAADKCVPTAMLMAISKFEAGGVWGWEDEEVAFFSQDRWWEGATSEQLRQGYCYDTCQEPDNDCAIITDADGNRRETTVYGPMQFEEGTWSGIMGGMDPMNRCRLDLAIEAAAIKIKGNASDCPPSYCIVDDSANCSSWSEQTVRYVARRYCGSCGLGGCINPANPPNECDAACGGEVNGVKVDYCENVWLSYYQYANQ